MIIRGLDAQGDWVYGKGKSDYAKNLDGLEIDLATRLRSWKFDCFFASQEGVDYRSYLAKNTQPFLEADIKRVILQTEGVTVINSFSAVFNENERNLTIEADISTIYGELTNFNVSV